MGQPWYRKATVQASIVGALIWGLFTLLALNLSNRPETTTSTPPPAKKETLVTQHKEIPKKVVTKSGNEGYSAITLDQFYATFYGDTLTELQQDEFVRKLINRSMTWEGVVKSVESDSSGTITVLVYSEKDEWAKAFMKFDKKDREELLRIKPKQKIRATGILRNVVASPFLRECTLLEVWD